jgi:putative ABC transport system ATP-binding protein
VSAAAVEPATPLYTLEGVARRYERGGSTVHALVGVDLSIARGELLAIEGPSGSGKSTLLQLLGALDTPSEGRIDFDGQHLARADDKMLTRLRRDAIGFVFQQFNLIPTLTAAENIEIAMLPLKRPRAERAERAATLLEQVGLADRRDHLPSRLSGGEQQRVAIARALANAPRVVLADEPTGNLDSATAGDVIDLLAGLCADSGVTVIIVTHDGEIAARARRRIRLRNGRVESDTIATS